MASPAVSTKMPAQNVVAAFYQATFPSLVRDLPKMVKSEEEVAAGLKT